MKKNNNPVVSKWSLRVKILTLYYAVRDSQTPWYARLTALSSLFYLLSPIDILPDVIPFLGYADDLVIVPLLMSAATTMLPDDIKRKCEAKAQKQNRKIGWLLVLTLLAIALATALLYYFLFHRH